MDTFATPSCAACFQSSSCLTFSTNNFALVTFGMCHRQASKTTQTSSSSQTANTMMSTEHLCISSSTALQAGPLSWQIFKLTLSF